MPNHCSAPGCRSNYRGEPYTPVFKLPTVPQELRTQWLNALHRDNLCDLKNIYVCLHHFHPEDIITRVDKNHDFFKKIKKIGFFLFKSDFLILIAFCNLICHFSD